MTSCTPQSGTCTKCQGACQQKPGWFRPGEAEKVAEYLGLTLQECFDQYLSVDYWVMLSDDDIYVLSPAIVTDDGTTAGLKFPSWPQGTCVFFKDGRCGIHEVKPYECRTWWCGEPIDADPDRHLNLSQEWLPYQTLPRELLAGSMIEP